MLVLPTMPKVHKDKFEPRATPHVFIGYPFGTKGYKVLSLDTKKIQVSRVVSFHENIFFCEIVSNVSSFPFVLKCVPFVDIFG